MNELNTILLVVNLVFIVLNVIAYFINRHMTRRVGEELDQAKALLEQTKRELKEMKRLNQLNNSEYEKHNKALQETEQG